MAEITDYGVEEFTNRLLANFPRDWSGSAAREKGGNLYGFFKAMGIPLDHLLKLIIYTQKGIYVQYAEGEALDTVARDYFGDLVARTNGESDSSFRDRLIAEILSPKQTVAAIKRAVQAFTGYEPIVTEPWNPVGAAYFDANSFYDVDTNDNPGKYLDSTLRYQFFVDAKLPGYTNNGGQPVYGYDSFCAFDVPQCPYFEPDLNWFKTIQKLDELIVRTKPAGTIAWRKYASA